MASIITVDDLCPETDAAIRTVVATEFPEREARIRLVVEESQRDIIRVFLPVPKLTPSPYVVYAVDRHSHSAKRLAGDEAKPYLIPNYK